MEKYQKDFVTNVKFFRREKKISQAQLAEACNVSTGTIGNIECGIAKPSFDLIITIAEVLDVEPAALFASTEIATLPEKKNNLIEEHKMLSEIYTKLKKYFENL